MTDGTTKIATEGASPPYRRLVRTASSVKGLRRPPSSVALMTAEAAIGRMSDK